MNKYEIKYLLETMTSSVDRLTDSLGKQSLHIENLWNEIGEKQNLISSQRYEIKRLKEKLFAFWKQRHEDKLEEADWGKKIQRVCRGKCGPLMDNRKYYRPKEIEQVFGIKTSTLAKQRGGKYGLPYTIVGRNPKKNRGGVILYNVDDIEDYINKKGRSTLY